MFGLICNNLTIELENFIIQKGQGLLFKNDKLLDKDNFIKTIEQILDLKVENLILETTSFNDDSQVLEFIYQFKMSNNSINLIVISLSPNINKQLAILGVYNIIDYKKGIELKKEINQLLIKPNTLADISQYINLNNLDLNVSEGKENYHSNGLVTILSLDDKCFTTFFSLNFSNFLKKSNHKSIYIESPFKNSELIDYYKCSQVNYETNYIEQINQEIIFSQHQNIPTTENDILALLLRVSSFEQHAILNIGNILYSDHKLIDLIIESTHFLIIIDSDSEITKQQQNYIYFKDKLIQYSQNKIFLNKSEIYVDEINKQTKNLILINNNNNLIQKVEDIIINDLKLISDKNKYNNPNIIDGFKKIYSSIKKN